MFEHVFKFTAEADGLRQLKREYTISELLSRSASTADSVAHICGRNFETPPFYLEYPFLGPDLLKWSEDKQQLSALSRTERLSLFLQIADTVAAAHSIGVLHKDPLGRCHILFLRYESPGGSNIDRGTVGREFRHEQGPCWT